MGKEKKYLTDYPEQTLYFYLKQQFQDAKNRYYPEERLEIDIYLPSERIGIEYDGGYYHSSERKKKIDIKKNKRLKELGITLIRVVESGGEAPVETEYIVECKRVSSTLLIDDATVKLFRLLSGIIGRELIADVDSERDRTAIMEQYILSEKENGLASIAPETITEWHTTKNGKIKPEYVPALSNKQFWWRCKHGHCWQAHISHRVRNNNCPYCGNKLILPGYNDFATVYPEMLPEWDEENETAPNEVLSGSNRKIKWICSKGHKWEAAISNRIRGNGCPYCAGVRTIAGVNDLQTINPELAKEWDFEKNDGKIPQDYMPNSRAKVWWRCSTCRHEWEASIGSRSKGRYKCPNCRK